MNKLVYNIMMFAIGFIGMYLLGAFIAWDINAGNWNDAGRYMIGCLGCIIGAVLVISEGKS